METCNSLRRSCGGLAVLERQYVVSVELMVWGDQNVSFCFFSGRGSCRPVTLVNTSCLHRTYQVQTNSTVQYTYVVMY